MKKTNYLYLILVSTLLACSGSSQKEHFGDSFLESESEDVTEFVTKVDGYIKDYTGIADLDSAYTQFFYTSQLVEDGFVFSDPASVQFAVNQLKSMELQNLYTEIWDIMENHYPHSGKTIAHHEIDFRGEYWKFLTSYCPTVGLTDYAEQLEMAMGTSPAAHAKLIAKAANVDFTVFETRLIYAVHFMVYADQFNEMLG